MKLLFILLICKLMVNMGFQKCQCGIPNQSTGTDHIAGRNGLGTHGTDYVAGGEETEQNEYPWQVYLKVFYDAMRFKPCGGTLISDRHVLTAAHCTSGELGVDFNIEVHLGEHNIKDGNVIMKTKVVNFINHPDYKSKGKLNDFSILTIASPVEYSDKIRPACLPSDAEELYENQVATVSGWGALWAGWDNTNNKHVQGPSPSLLQKVDVEVKDNQNCSNIWPYFNGDVQMCASGIGSNPCNGDSGGPLALKENDRYTVIGVTSYGAFNCTHLPAVYGRVTKLLPWILANSEGTFNSRCESI